MLDVTGGDEDVDDVDVDDADGGGKDASMVPSSSFVMVNTTTIDVLALIKSGCQCQHAFRPSKDSGSCEMQLILDLSVYCSAKCHIQNQN
jgi:hypothetical protein